MVLIEMIDEENKNYLLSLLNTRKKSLDEQKDKLQKWHGESLDDEMKKGIDSLIYHVDAEKSDIEKIRNGLSEKEPEKEPQL